MPRGRLVLAALLMGAATAAAQDAPSDPKQVLGSARSAIQLARSFTYRARYEGTGIMQPSVPAIAADVAVERMITGGPVTARVAITGQMSTGNKAAAAAQLVFDGRKVRWPNPDGTVSVADPGDDHGVLLKRPEFAVVPAELVAEEPFTAAIEGATLTLEGRKIVESVNCDIVLIEYPSSGGAEPVRQRWWIGADDHLPRKLEVPLKAPAPDGTPKSDASILLTLSSLRRADTPPARTKFRLTGTREIEVPADAKPGKKPAGRQPPPEKEKPAARRGLVPVGSPAPDWELKDPAGAPHTLAEFKGKVLVLDFWATWCAPCKESMPRLQALHDKYSSRPVAVVGISSGEKADPAAGPAAFMRDHKLTYGLMVEGDAAAAAYGVTQIPTVYLISPEGKVLFRAAGLSDTDLKRIETIIEAQLKRMK